MNLSEKVTEMQLFLGITTKWHKRYQLDCDFRSGCSEQEWLESEYRKLKAACERKLVADFNTNLGNRLFTEKFNF